MKDYKSFAKKDANTSKIYTDKNTNQPEIKDDVMTDSVQPQVTNTKKDFEVYFDELIHSNKDIIQILKQEKTIDNARKKLYDYLSEAEMKLFEKDNPMHMLERATAQECIRVFRNILAPINEHHTQNSSLDYLLKLVKKEVDQNDISPGFLLEFIHLFKGINGKSTVYEDEEVTEKSIPSFLKMHGHDAAVERTKVLDETADTMQKFFKKYPSGLDKDIIKWREENKKRILDYFGGTQEDWHKSSWQLKNVIKDTAPLKALLDLSPEQLDAIDKATDNKIPFGITPYYLSLMDKDAGIGYDHAVRKQVIPPVDYIDMMVDNKDKRDTVFDFMGEHDTSPVELITRRYPGIAILKPFNTCAQICVYCQRNWEIDEVLDPKAMADKAVIRKALSWFDEHPGVGDVLITGGDPMVMRNKPIRDMLEILAEKEHVYRIRFGTRTPVVLPQRWTDELTSLLAEYNVPGRRQISIVTHFEHSYEITPEAARAIAKIRKAGMSVYNQEVFTQENSRRFESAKLRLDLKSIGIDPYYNFNMKGKEETKEYMVPVARILQERKEEARLLPGLDRTDEPVFNVPKLGKNHLRAWQDHKLISILPTGARIYEFHPWEKNIHAVPPYNYTDVPIYKYLSEMQDRGEDLHDYRTIWYYF